MIKRESVGFKIAWGLLGLNGVAVLALGVIFAVWPRSGDSLYLLNFQKRMFIPATATADPKRTGTPRDAFENDACG